MMACVITPGVPTAMPSAIVLVPCGWCVPLMALTMAGKARGLHADDLDAGLERLGRRGHAGDQPAAADGDHQHVQLGHGVQHLQPHRALAGDDGFVVVGVHEHQPFALGQLQGMGARLVERVAVQHHLGAKAARALDLHARREARHDDHGAHAQALRVVGHALRMVARAHGDHAALRARRR